MPGEIAFDRCFIPVAILATLGGTEQAVRALWLGDAERLPETSPRWAAYEWLWCGIGLAFACLWVRALLTLVRAWRDPSARILRFSASVLLIPFATAVWLLLRAPFR